MLKHDQIPLTLLILHLLLERRTKRIKRVTTGGSLSIREETKPFHTSNDPRLFLLIRELRLSGDSSCKVRFLLGLNTEMLSEDLLPGGGSRKGLSGFIRQEPNIDKGADELRESLVTESTTDDSLRLGDVVAFLVRGRVTVGVSNECIAGVDEVGLSSLHEIRPRDLFNLSVLPELCGVAESEEHTAGGPGELVPEWVTRIFRSRETSAVGEEGNDLAPGRMDFINHLDGVEVVDAGVETNLVEDSDAGVDSLLVELLHCGGDVGSRDDMLLRLDGGFDDLGVVSVGDQAGYC